MRLVTVLNQTWAVGLFWQVRSGGPASRAVMLQLAREQAREFSKEGYNCVVTRAQQYGLGQYKIAGARQPLRGACSLAAAIRPSMNAISAISEGSDAFVGLFCLGNTPEGEALWWVCAISRGFIAANGDEVFTSREEAELAATDRRKLFGKTTEIHCETLEETESYLAALLKPETRVEELFPSANKRRMKQFQIAALLALIGCVVGGIWGYGYLQEQAAAKQQAASAAANARYKRELKDSPERFFTMAWQHAPRPAVVGRQCLPAMLGQPFSLQGWTMAEMSCVSDTSGQILVVQREHTPGASYNLPPRSRLASAQKLTTNLPLPTLQKREPYPYAALPTKEEGAALLYQLTQNIRANLQTLTWENPEQVTQDDLTLVAPWQRGIFELTDIPSAVLPDVCNALDYSGLVIKAVVYNNKAWKIQGVSYVKTKP